MQQAAGVPNSLPPTIASMASCLAEEWRRLEDGRSDALLAAIEGYMLDAPADTLEDAAAQIMVTYGRLAGAPADQLRALRPRLEAALLSSWRVLAHAAASPALLAASEQYVPDYVKRLAG